MLTLQVGHDWTFPGGSVSKESACNAGELGSIPGLGRSHGEGNGNPLCQYSFLENPHGQRSLAGYSQWGRKESDMTACLSTAQHRSWWVIKYLWASILQSRYYHIRYIENIAKSKCGASLKEFTNWNIVYYFKSYSMYSGCDVWKYARRLKKWSYLVLA